MKSIISENLIGNKYGRLEVIGYVGKEKTCDLWLCKCVCGNEISLKSFELISGHRKSCGCFHNGLSKHPLRSVYVNMITRCYNKKAHNYKYYGGKGVRVCDEWKDSFYSFYKWAIVNGYDVEHKKDSQLDRIDSNGDYCPENCRFVDRYVQANNKGNNVRVLFKGEMLTHREIYNKYCTVNYHTFLTRIYSGWDLEEAALTPKIGSGYKRPSKRI